jgi:predicted nucleic acid-binding protein
MVEALLRSPSGTAALRRMADHAIHVPAHLDAEVLSAIGRAYRAGEVPASRVLTALRDLAAAPIHRHALPPLLAGAWGRRHQLRLADALYVELADALGAIPLLTTDARLARAVELAELVAAPAP